jgi:hypothetical protein
VPVDQVKIRPGSSVGAERAGQSLSSADALPADFNLNVGIRRPSYYALIEGILCCPDIANSLDRNPNLGRAAEVTDASEHRLPLIKPLLGTQYTNILRAL